MLELCNRLEETCKIARDSLYDAQSVYKHHYDKSTRQRRLKKRDKVLLLLPTTHNKLMLQWKGPYEVVEVVNRMDYKVKVDDRVGTYHMSQGMDSFSQGSQRQMLFKGLFYRCK